MKRLNIFAGALFAIAAGSLTAAPSQAVAQQLEKVTVVGSTWPGHAPTWVAIEKGYFKEAGFDATFSLIAGSMDRISVISSGDAVFGGMGAAAMVPAMAQGNKAFYWIGSNDAARSYSGIVAKAEIKSLRDLKGKKLAVQFGGAEEVTSYYLLQKIGIDMYKEVTLINIPQSNMIQALKEGHIDAAAAWSPEFEQLQKLPGAHSVASVDDLGFWKKYKQMPVPDVIIINKAWTDANLPRAKRFLNAYFKGMDYVIANPQETARISTKYTNQPASQYTVAINTLNFVTKKEQLRQLSDQGAYPVMDMLLSFMHDQVKKIDKKPNYKDWVRVDVYAD